MELIEGSTQYKFIPNKVINFSNIKISDSILENDIFIKYNATTQIQGEYIICKDISKLKKYSNKIIKETYQEYLDFLKIRDIEKDRWIYNIIDEIAEQDKLLYKDTNLVIFPSYTWDSNNLNKLHILCIPTNKNLRTIRDLTFKDLNLLNNMKLKTLQIIEENFNLKEENLKIFFHYDPSTYHLHIHFVNIDHNLANSSVEYSHELDTVIFNLMLDGDYYKKIKLNRRV